jgi:hypothetical protein
MRFVAQGKEESEVEDERRQVEKCEAHEMKLSVENGKGKQEVKADIKFESGGFCGCEIFMVFWAVTACRFVGGYQSYEEHTASIFRNR